MTQRKYPAREDIPGFTASESAEDVLFAELAAGSTESLLPFYFTTSCFATFTTSKSGAVQADAP
jgi:hypothetical protein